MTAKTKQNTKQRKRKVVGRPLEPTIMSKMGALDNSPLPSGAFEPMGDWTHNYRIWTCAGYMSPKQNQGSIEIQRSGTSKKDFNLKIEQLIHLHPKKAKQYHHITADIRCRNSKLASPTSWTFSSRFTGGPANEAMPEIDQLQKTKLNGHTLETQIGSQSSRQKVSRNFTADWCLFEAVQRLPFGKDNVLQFDLLEALTLWKPNQELSYRGVFPVNWGGQSVTLTCFQQLGVGVWPYEYWLDEKHRLVMVVTGSRVYIWESTKEV